MCEKENGEDMNWIVVKVVAMSLVIATGIIIASCSMQMSYKNKETLNGFNNGDGPPTLPYREKILPAPPPAPYNGVGKQELRN
jgi:hypothetical protein